MPARTSLPFRPLAHGATVEKVRDPRMPESVLRSGHAFSVQQWNHYSPGVMGNGSKKTNQ